MSHKENNLEQLRKRRQDNENMRIVQMKQQVSKMNTKLKNSTVNKEVSGLSSKNFVPTGNFRMSAWTRSFDEGI